MNHAVVSANPFSQVGIFCWQKTLQMMVIWPQDTATSHKCKSVDKHLKCGHMTLGGGHTTGSALWAIKVPFPSPL